MGNICLAKHVLNVNTIIPELQSLSNSPLALRDTKSYSQTVKIKDHE
jgi:hypothetical protein